MSIYALKPRFQALLRPLARALFDAGVTANQVTLAACAVSVALGAWLAFDPTQTALFLLVPAWFFLRMAFNAIDGMLAREFGQNRNWARTSTRSPTSSRTRCSTSPSPSFPAPRCWLPAR